MSKVEEVAKAILDDLKDRSGVLDGIDDDVIAEIGRDTARAAIEAMREPTEAMAEAGCKDQPWGYGINDAMQTWRSMIDAALSEQEQG
jgi:hypothetical protein